MTKNLVDVRRNVKSAAKPALREAQGAARVANCGCSPVCLCGSSCNCGR